MSFKLPQLPFNASDLEPYISKETIEYHHGKHHKTYVDNLNKLIVGTAFEHATLEEIVRQSTGPIFNNGAQVWNHTFYWDCLSPRSGGDPQGALAAAIDQEFGSIAAFKEKFTQMCLSHFGSGWVWLVKNSANRLEIVSTANAGNPLTDNKKPLLTCDVWEHAYYIDTRNSRANYVDNFWHVVNWEFVAKNFA